MINGMPSIKNFLQKHTYEIHTLAFVLMVLASLGLYFAAGASSAAWIWALLGVFGLANLLVLFVK